MIFTMTCGTHRTVARMRARIARGVTGRGRISLPSSPARLFAGPS
jgi:hypothetical protein